MSNCRCPYPGIYHGAHCRAMQGFKYTSDEWCSCSCHREPPAEVTPAQKTVDLLHLVALYLRVLMHASPDACDLMRTSLTDTAAAIDALESKLGLSGKMPSTGL